MDLLIVQSKEVSDYLRELYILSFVNTNVNGYVENIQKRYESSDGQYYCGYLWDYLKQKQRISLEKCLSFLSEKKNVYVLWDIHSKDRILIPDYWKYPKESVVQIFEGVTLEVIKTFPEDVYFFDDSLSWTIAFTHEELKTNKRICYYSGRLD